MIRDFTAETKERLLKEIVNINSETESALEDTIGDLIRYCGNWLNILHLNEDMHNVKTYHRHILDMTDMTKKELQNIFVAVCALDDKYSKLFKTLDDQQTIYNKKIKILSEKIQPNFSIASAKDIKTAVSEVNTDLKKMSKKIEKEYGQEMDESAKDSAKEAIKATAFSVIDMLLNIALMPVNMTVKYAEGKGGGICSLAWSLINDVFAVGGNLASLIYSGAYWAEDLMHFSNLEKENNLGKAEAYADVSSLSEALEADIKSDGSNIVTSLLLKLTHILDAFDGAYGIFNDVTDILEDKSLNSLVDPNFGFDRIKPLKKSNFSKKLVDSGEWKTYQKLHKHLIKNRQYVILSRLKTIIKYAKILFETDADKAEEFLHELFSSFFEPSGYVDTIDGLEKVLDDYIP